MRLPTTDDVITDLLHEVGTLSDRVASLADLAERVEVMEAAVAATQAKLTPPPFTTCHIDDVQANGRWEIRWPLDGGRWSLWHRVVRLGVTSRGTHRALGFAGVGGREEFTNVTAGQVQVRPVMDPQTGDMLGDVA